MFLHCSFTGLTTGISLLVDARNTKIHGPVKQLLDKLVVSTPLNILLLSISHCHEWGMNYVYYHNYIIGIITIMLSYIHSWYSMCHGWYLILDARYTLNTHNACFVCQSKEIPLDVHVVYVYMKSRIFGRGKPLTGPEAASKLQVSTTNLPYAP